MSSSDPENPNGLKQDVESDRMSSNAGPSPSDLKTAASGSSASRKEATPKGSTSTRNASDSKKKVSANFLISTVKEKSVRTGEDVVKSLKWVIFPDNKYIKAWDLVVLAGLFLFSFIIPYQIGVSGSIALVYNIPWLVFNIFLNSIFVVDTFLYFFRAYYASNGHLVLDLKKIRRCYLSTLFVPNLLSVLPYTLGFYILATLYIESSGNRGDAVRFLSLILFASLLKLLRFSRAKTILARSDVVTNFRQKRNSQVLELWKYVWLIVIVSHWFACIWSFVAIVQADGLSAEKFTATPNWIGGWYADNATDGGLNPLGWDHALDRYILSLFWAIQTITSIGYGNIVPVTRAEYFVACCIQLCAGVMWAYVIGGLTGVVAGMGVRAEAYRHRSDEANELIKALSDDNGATTLVDEDGDSLSSYIVAKHVRKYIHSQYVVAKGNSCVSTIQDYYPVFNTLTPELQEASSVLLLNQYFNIVPYLSSKYLNFKEQAKIAQQCVNLQFAAGELIHTECPVEGLGRGVYIFRGGCAFALRQQAKGFKEPLSSIHLVTSGIAYGVGNVLLQDENPFGKGRLNFLTFSQLVFIPRKAIMDVLQKNERAWKDCARWVYVRTLLRAAKADHDLRESGEKR